MEGSSRGNLASHTSPCFECITGHDVPDIDKRWWVQVSGGGANGAFAAGLLKGWSERGDRPEFDIVTGISTGALIGPLAFLGPKYDDELKEAYTTLKDENVFKKRRFLRIIRSLLRSMYLTSRSAFGKEERAARCLVF